VPTTGSGVAGAAGGNESGGPDVFVGLLGPLEVRVGDARVEIGSAKHRVLMACLALRPGAPVSVEELAEAIWGEALPQHPQRAVRIHMTRFRAALARAGLDGIVTTTTSGYRLELPAGSVDLGRFRALLEQAACAAGWGAAEEEAWLLCEAVALWRGEPLADVASDVLCRDVVPDLREQRLSALERHYDAEIRCGRASETIPPLTALTSRHPARERLWAALMTALRRTGRRADALQAYHTARRYLADELGIDPGAELQACHTAVLAGRAGPGAGAPGPVTAAFPVPRQLPPAPAGFVGRRSALASLDTAIAHPDRLQPTGAARILVVSGTAGVGKTTLVAHWARRVVEDFPDGQLWVNLRGYDPGQTVTPGQALRRMLRALGVPDPQAPPDLDDQVGLFRSLMDGRRTLLVFDNARSPEQIRPLLPGGDANLVVVTSRNRLSGLAVSHGAVGFSLDLLTPAEAHDLLTTRIGPDRLAREPRAAREILTLCARLPLALTIAAARAGQHTQSSLQDLAHDLRCAPAGLDPFTGTDLATEIRAVFSWSYHALSEQAARLFRLLGHHPGPDTSRAAAASLAGLPIESIRASLQELCDAHLLTEHQPGRYTCHDLLRAYARELSHQLDPTPARETAHRRLLDHYLHTATRAAAHVRCWESITPAPPAHGVTVQTPADLRRALDWYHAEHPVLLAAITHADTGLWRQACQLAWTLAEYLYRQGMWHDWILVEQQALDVAIRNGGLAEQARSHRELARAHARLGRTDQAEAHCRQALHLCERLADPHGTATAHRVFGIIHEAQGRHRQALAHDRAALDIVAAHVIPRGWAHVIPQGMGLG
jgi:DNA-binding SARP family transcriptional activator/tetratricopeptide (TPR) repeat protein